MATIICGIDPGLGTTGYAVIRSSSDGIDVLDAGACTFDAKLPLAQRLVDVERDIVSILEEYKPDVVAVEELYAHYKHPRTAILMGHARGVILLAAARRGCEVLSLEATRVKKHLTGNGRATKEQVQHAIRATLGLTEFPEPADVADALAIALCGVGELSRARVLEAKT